MKVFVFKKFKLLAALTAAGLGLLIAAQALAAELEVPLPGMPKDVTDPGVYIRYLFIFGLSVVGFLAVGGTVIGGIQYMLAGTLTSTEKALKTIISSLGGVFLLLCSYLLLYTIDPSLINLSPTTPPKITLSGTYKAIQDIDLDLPAEALKSMTAGEIRLISIPGQSTGACAIKNCGSTTKIGGKILSVGAATNYENLRTKIQAACAGGSAGLYKKCDIAIRSGVDGEHLSTCHKPGTADSGTCADFVITAPECGGNIKNCSAENREKYIQAAAGAMNTSGALYIKSCLNEYKVKTALSTGGHFHCNF